MTLYEINEALGQILDNEELFDKEVFERAVAELNLNKEQKCENIIRMIKNMDSDVNAISEEIKRLQAKKKTLENKVTGLKGYLKSNLELEGRKNYKAGLFTITLRNNAASINVLDESLIADNFKKISYTVDKTAIKEAIKNGEIIEGVEMVQTTSLTIK